jgi:hypothetical protein
MHLIINVAQSSSFVEAAPFRENFHKFEREIFRAYVKLLSGNLASQLQFLQNLRVGLLNVCVKSLRH